VTTDARLGAIGVLASDGMYLLVKRAEGLSNAGAWCFPGGHVDPGETSREAVVRELAEELGLEVEPLALLGTAHVASPAYRLDVWTVKRVSGEIRLHAPEIADARFLTVEEIRALSLAMPSNAQVLALLGHPG
jgi:mutator protein MutT